MSIIYYKFLKYQDGSDDYFEKLLIFEMLIELQ